MSENCIFCKIASGEIPSYTVFENDEFRVLLDRFPSSAGHLLIVPKVHASDVFEIDPVLCGRLYQFAAKAAKVLKQALSCDGINILQNNGEAAGQTVNHFHIHLIPRYKGDDVKIAWKPLDPSDDEFKNALERIDIS